MGQFIKTQNPDFIRSGSSLQQESTPGRNVDFIGITDIGYVAQSVSAGGTYSITAGASIYDEDLPEALRNSDTVKDSSQVTVWPFFNIFVDTDNDFNYIFGSGASLTTEQKNITMAQYDRITPNSGYSLVTEFLFKNNDASSHTIYFYVGAKYVITG